MASPSLVLSNEPIRATVRRDIAQRVLDGLLAPGTQIQPATLAADYGVSATPVREALIELVHDGFLENRARRGFCVRPLTADEVEELYPLIWSLEALAVRSTTPDRTRLDELDRINARLGAATDPRVVHRLDDEWHRLLVAASPNATLHELLHVLKRRVSRYEDAYMRHAGSIGQSVDHHAAITAALRSGDVDRATATLEANWRIGLEFLVPWLRESAPAPHASTR